MTRITIALVCLTMGSVAMTASAAEPAKPTGELLVYIGTYSGPKSQGIYATRLNLASGKCGPVELVAEVKNPSFLAIHPTQKYLYAVSEISDLGGKPAGGVSAFEIDRTSGKLRAINAQSSVGAGPCHLVVDRSGSTVLVANYGGGSVASLRIGSDGSLSPAASFIQHEGKSVNASRQESPHAHSINMDLGNRFAVAADLGLDKVLVYKLDPATSKITANNPPSAAVPPGSGPRHFAFHPGGRWAYVINEILCTVTAFDYDAEHGVLTPKQTITTLPAGVQLVPEFSTAEVQVHPSGKFVYGSNRGHDSITLFAVNDDGTLKFVENTSTEGKTPRGFGIDPTGQYLLAGNQDSHTVTVFRIDPATGKLKPTGQKLEVGTPVCVKFVAP